MKRTKQVGGLLRPTMAGSQMLRTTLATMVVALAPTLAAAEPCGKRADFLDILMVEYDEAPISVGRGSAGEVYEVFASENGTWTVIVTDSSGRTCGVEAGQAWLPSDKDRGQSKDTSLVIARGAGLRS